MHILSDTGTTLTLVTGSAVSTDYVIDYVDHTSTTFSPLSGRGNVTTAETTTILAAPAASTTRQVKSIKITNRHESSSQTVQVFVVASAVSYALSKNIALAAGQCVLLNDKGWTIMSDQGQVVVAMGTATLSSGTATVSTTAVSATSRIFLTIQSLGTVTSPKSVAVTDRVAGTSFAITSSDSTDTSVVAWMIVDPA